MLFTFQYHSFELYIIDLISSIIFEYFHNFTISLYLFHFIKKFNYLLLPNINFNLFVITFETGIRQNFCQVQGYHFSIRHQVKINYPFTMI